jgi:hypothetical protein
VLKRRRLKNAGEKSHRIEENSEGGTGIPAIAKFSAVVKDVAVMWQAASEIKHQRLQLSYHRQCGV